MTSRAATVTFAVVLGAAILLRVYLVLALPFGQTVAGRHQGLNDEPAHFNYVRHLAEHRAFPVQTHHVAEPGAFERADFEYYQPPLYYLLGAPLVAVAGIEAGVTLCRSLSLLFGLISLIVLSRILALLGLGSSARRAGVAFAALLPVHVYFTSVVSNDGLCWLFALLITHELLIRASGAGAGATGAGGHGGRSADLRLGVLLGLGLLTKSALAVFYPAVVLAYALMERRRPGRRLLAGALVAIGVSLLIAAPWYVRNVGLYGSPFAIEVGFGPPEPGRWSVIAQAWAAAGTVWSFWFPTHLLSATPAAAALRKLEVILAALHATAAIVFLVRRLPFDAPTFTAGAVLALVVASHVALNLTWGESEGRFLLPALGPLVFLFVAPVFAWAAKRRHGDRVAWIYTILLAAHPYAFLALR